MRILHVLNTNRFSGAENVVCQIISVCKSDIADSFYCSMDGQIRESLIERGIDFVPINEMSISEIKRVIKEVYPDVIHAHDMRAGFFASLSCGMIPLVLHVHNNAYNSRGVSLKSCLFYLAAKKAKHIFWVSRSSFDGYAFHKSFSNKSSILYNVIDLEALKKKTALDENIYEYELLYLGRLTAQKNPHRLIDVLRLIVDKRPETKIAIVGTGELEGETRNLIIEKGLSKNVTMLGFQSNPTKILHDAKVMIMTSRWEGTPMCALEAMSLGVPIVSTPTDGLCEVIDEGNTGYLSDDNNVLSEKCIELLENKEKQHRMSALSIERAKTLMKMEEYKLQIQQVYIGACNET